MDSVIEARRAKFEACMSQALIDEGYDSVSVPCLMNRGSDGQYSSVRIRGAWQGYNAALDSLVVELPPITQTLYTKKEAYFCAKQTLEWVTDSIHAAGVKTK